MDREGGIVDGSYGGGSCFSCQRSHRPTVPQEVLCRINKGCSPRDFEASRPDGRVDGSPTLSPVEVVAKGEVASPPIEGIREKTGRASLTASTTIPLQALPGAGMFCIRSVISDPRDWNLRFRTLCPWMQLSSEPHEDRTSIGAFVITAKLAVSLEE